jgi:Na+-driven multidrug efflux pump
MLATLGQIIAMALPFALGAIITSALNLGKISMLARSGSTHALEVLSLLQPAFIFVLAVMEGLAITNQVFSARSRNNWPRAGIKQSSLSLAMIGVTLLCLASTVAYGIAHTVIFTDRSIDTIVRNLPAFLMSMSAFVVFDIYYGALRGQAKLARSLLPFAALVTIDLAVTYVLTRYGWGFEAVLAGNVAGPLATLPIVILLLRHEAGTGPQLPRETLHARLRQLLAVVGTPLAASILAGSISAVVVFPALAAIGKDYASAFLVVLRFRTAFMIPAIAVGSVIAILINQVAEDSSPADGIRYLAIGIPAILTGYALLTVALPYWGGPILDLLLSQRGGDQDLRAASVLVMRQIQVTFFLVAGTAMLQVILEQLGRAPHVLVITFAMEAATCLAITFSSNRNGGLHLLLMTLNVIAAVTFMLLAAQAGMLFMQLRRGHVV